MTNTKIWLETLAETCHCYPDEVGNMPCDNGCPCDRCCADWVQDVYKSKLNKQLDNELSKIAQFMSRNDPNGEYTVSELKDAPELFIEVLERWKSDMGMESTEAERIRFDDMISTLYVVEMLHA